MIKKIITTGLIFCFTFISSGIMTIKSAHAEETKKPVYEQVVIPKPELIPGIKHTPGTRNELVNGVLPRFALSIISFVGALTVLFLIIGAVRYMTTYGKEEAAENAKKQIMYSLVGFLLAIMSYTIVKIIINLDFGDTQSNSEELKQIQEMTDDALEDSENFDPTQEPDYTNYDYGIE